MIRMRRRKVWILNCVDKTSKLAFLLKFEYFNLQTFIFLVLLFYSNEQVHLRLFVRLRELRNCSLRYCLAVVYSNWRICLNFRKSIPAEKVNGMTQECSPHSTMNFEISEHRGFEVNSRGILNLGIISDLENFKPRKGRAFAWIGTLNFYLTLLFI